MANGRYDHQALEQKWQKRWEDKGVFSAPSPPRASDTAYVLDMFPYPSGDGLHVGHPIGYIATDIYSRYLRMKGEQVLHPMGWDAFGLPTENAAIKKGVHPAVVTKQNIANFKRQIQSLGFSYDWDREINTTDSKYYRWTQWIFLQLFKKGLAYEKEAPIWWCPKDKTGLANEEVVDGKCERCGTTVEKKLLKQWMLKITAYADRLLSGLDELDWPAGIKTLQRNWIGKSEGTEISFELVADRVVVSTVKVFTTRPDTLFGATYLVLSPEHELVSKITTKEQKQRVEKYVKSMAAKSDLERTALEKEKTGVFTGAYAINPVNQEKIPVWIADYVLASYGTGAIMAVPGHDQRDYDFAKKYDLPIREVVLPYRYYQPNPPLPGKKTVERRNVHAIVRNPTTGKVLALKWKKFPWTTFPMGGIDEGEDIVEAAKRELQEETGYLNVDFERVLGGQVKAEYFAAHKDENRISYTSAVCFVLRDEQRREVVDDELAKHEVIWLDPKEMTPTVMTHAELDVWLTRLSQDEQAYTGEGAMINSGQFDGLLSEEGQKKIVAWLAKKGKAKTTVQYKLRDWVFSRQRYWGEPIPLVHCDHCTDVVESTPHHLVFTSEEIWNAVIDAETTVDVRSLKEGVSAGAHDSTNYIKGTFGNQIAYFRVKKLTGHKALLKHILPGIVTVPEKELPLELPNVEKYEPTGTGESPLAGIQEWVNVTCRVCGHPATRETNTMPQWAGSCWYYLRFTDPDNDKEFASAKAMKAWLPVDLYVGGAEHAVLHLLYARFWHKVLFDAGFIPKEVGDEPFAKLKNQGLILGPDGEKMSKSRGNVINPDEIVAKYGADTLRMYEMFMGPFEDAKPWDTNGIVGVRRFLEKVWRAKENISNEKNINASEHEGAGTAYEVTKGIGDFKFNTCISDLMKWVNRWGFEKTISRREYEMFLKVLSPFAPHIAEELWSAIGNKDLLTQTQWPHTERWAKKEATIAVQVMGKLRGTLSMPAGADQSAVVAAAKAEANVAKHLVGEPKKVIYVKDKLINFVV